MSTQVTLGGDRLGTGNKNKIELHGYGRSTHNLSEVWRSTMSSGTLVPFLTKVALPGDSFEIDLNIDVKTHPTIGPLFGSYKVQVDVFVVPIRLYQGLLHMNMLNIGNKISQIKLPQIYLQGNELDVNKEMSAQQVNPSCIMSYLGLRGLGTAKIKGQGNVGRYTNAVPILGYWDIYKNYYANKQEEIGYVIHNQVTPLVITLGLATLYTYWSDEDGVNLSQDPAVVATDVEIKTGANAVFEFTSAEEVDPSRVTINFHPTNSTYIGKVFFSLPEIFSNISWDALTSSLICTEIKQEWVNVEVRTGKVWIDRKIEVTGDIPVGLRQFPLSNIDQMRIDILRATEVGQEFLVNDYGSTPYEFLWEQGQDDDKWTYALTGNQEGLGLKTYLSDIFNNWLNTEWIEGQNGINEITAISTDSGQITIDEINLSNKIYKMLTRIAVSDGSFDSYITATYDHRAPRKIESPMYVGGLSQELVFQEVISNTATINEPLGTLAGRGKLNNNRKGGKVNIKIDEHSYIMGIVSLTPRIDYSQGNNWDVNLKNMDDFHKPALDEIGFQDLITEQMAYWETRVDNANNVEFRSAGKQPAWINYMTSYNKTYGNFAMENQQMFMTLNRRYGVAVDVGKPIIEDLTTYIDPAKFNQIFADTRRDSQNFWVQIGSSIKARRKMSNKVMPNL